jgi:integrase
MRGSITKRGTNSWRLKFDVDADNGKRVTRYVTVHGARKDAERELVRLLGERDRGTLPDQSKLTVGAYLHQSLAGKHDLSPRSREVYLEQIDRRIVPVLGEIELQKLRPAHVKEWIDKLRSTGSIRTGGEISGNMARQIFRTLRAALRDAVMVELISRNVCDSVKAPRKKKPKVEILSRDGITAVLESLAGSQLYPIASLALASGCRRGELLALRWTDIELGRGVVKVERALEETKAGIRFKETKTEGGERSISLPASIVDVLVAHRKAQLERRMKLGLGKPGACALVFCDDAGEPIGPNALSVIWRRALAKHKLPVVTFHALRHTHASALIAAGVDVVAVSRRFGHSTPAFTLSVYAHLFDATKTDSVAAEAIAKMMST